MSRLVCVSPLVLGLFLVGCEGSPPASGTNPMPTTGVSAPHDHGGPGHAHDHPSEGPHHGVLVELGNEEYHAEVVHDDKAGTVTVYLLDGTAKKSATTAAAEVTINVKHGDKPEQFQLPAQPDPSDAPGTSSRFLLKDQELIEHLDEKGATASLQVSINGNPYSGKIPPGGHGHAHD